MEGKVVWKEGMAFEALLNGHSFMVDANKAVGGTDQGPSPKGLMLIALAGCTGMDVVSILKKMKEPVEGFEVETGAVTAEEHPKKILEMKVTYRLTSTEKLCKDKVKRAVELSEDRYCGVSATLKPQVKISHEIYVNGERVVAE
jgi:putative redox protein